MKPVAIGLLMIFLTLAPKHSEASVIVFDNFASGSTYDTGASWSLYNLPSSSGILDDAMAFIPSSNVAVDSIEIALGLVVGQNQATVWLASDVNGPGAVLESFTFTNQMGPRGSANPPLVAASTLDPVLLANTRYWLVASLPANTYGGWMWNSVSEVGEVEGSFDGVTWGSGGVQTQGAFKITGNPIPEPATYALLLGGLGLLLVIAKRKRTPLIA